MSVQNMTTNIVINAKVGNGFGKVGATLTEMGMIVQGISQQLIDLGEDSVRVYREYEKSMRDAEVALSTSYGRGTQQLKNVMSQLDDMATQWAATTIFHTDDVANAISEAAHAGWDLDRIMVGIPEAMELAQAGSLELSEALDYIVKSTYAAGVEFDELNHFTDIWTYAANRSATTVGEVGEAMLRMGGTMRFAASSEELMTLIGIMANSGYVGSEAGTLIRNSMMRLIVPTDKASKALAEMGATAEEIEEIVGDEHILAAYRALEEHGFRGLYDESGKMRPILEVYSEMGAVLGSMAGGMENISNNQNALDILGAIFPTRSITGALNIINAAANGYDGLFEALQSGAAEGYGEYAAVTMMDTLNGSILTFQSKAERLKQLIGGELTPGLEKLAEHGGNFFDAIAGLDEGKFSALVSGLTVIAAAGPAMLTAGAAFRLISLAATPIGAAALGITAATALAVALTDLAKSNFAAQFGTMALDSERLAGFLGGLSEEFSASRSEVEYFTSALDAAAKSYEDASGSFSSKLTSAMITGVTLSEDDYAQLEALADEMLAATLDVLGARAGESISYWTMLFGDDEENPALQELIDAAVRQAEQSTEEVAAAGDMLHEALFRAFSNDGVISPEEQEEIAGYVRAYNDAVAAAMAADEERRSRAELNATLHKAQTASAEEAQRYAEEIEGQRDSVLATAYDDFLREYYGAIEGNVSAETIAAVEAAWLAYRAEKEAPYNAALARLYNNTGGSFVDSDVIAATYSAAITENGSGSMSAASVRSGTALLREQLGSGAEGFLQLFGDVLTDWAPDLAHEWKYTEAYAQLEDADKFFLQEIFDAMQARYDLDAVSAAYGDPTNGKLGSELAVWRLLYGMTDEEAAGFEREATVTVTGDTRPVEEQIAALNGTPVSVNVVGGAGLIGAYGMKNYAEGGRADVPSIFGEAGAEWAIPEEHSRRTAALLDAARAASGFSWPELLERNGGLNALGGGQTTIVYSPTIHAADARGVEEALRADKRRMEDWWRERALRERMEVYA